MKNNHFLSGVKKVRPLVTGSLILIISSVFFMVFLSGCAIKNKQSMMFDKEKWGTKTGIEFDYRSAMIDDLINNQNLVGLTKLEIVELLGTPDYIYEDENFFTFQVETRYEFLRFGSRYIKTLKIFFNADNISTSYKVDEEKL